MNHRVYSLSEEEEEAICVLKEIIRISPSLNDPDYILTKCNNIRTAIESKTVNEDTLNYISNSTPREIIEEIESGQYDNI